MAKIGEILEEDSNGAKPKEVPKCVACRTPLNLGASRCASCGRFLGWRGQLIYCGTLGGAIVSVVSLVTIAITGYFDVLAPKRPTLSVNVSEATFENIRNLTCDLEKFGDEAPLTPATYGEPPGDLLLIEGVIENTGNLAGELRFSSGDIRFQDQERIARPLAAFGPVESGDRYFVNAGGTIPFTVRAPVYRDNSDGFYVAEIEIDPMETGRKLVMRERISLVFYTYASGQRTSQQLTQELDFYLEPVSRGWIVDGKEFTYLYSNL